VVMVMGMLFEVLAKVRDDWSWYSDWTSNKIEVVPGCGLDELSGFMTRFESRGAHGRGEQWNARDMRVYIGSGLREDKTLHPV
jgi:hypothetical protein